MTTRVLDPGRTANPTIRELGHSQECSKCRGQYAHMRYVDFDAAHDTGWYGGDGHIAKDDLVLCEECVKEAGRQIDMMTAEEVADLTAKNEELETLVRQLTSECNKHKRYADTLEEALTVLRKKPVKVDHRQKPRPARSV